jgi:hypothetical protein
MRAGFAVEAQTIRNLYLLVRAEFFHGDDTVTSPFASAALALASSILPALPGLVLDLEEEAWKTPSVYQARRRSAKTSAFGLVRAPRRLAVAPGMARHPLDIAHHCGSAPQNEPDGRRQQAACIDNGKTAGQKFDWTQFAAALRLPACHRHRCYSGHKY